MGWAVVDLLDAYNNDRLHGGYGVTCYCDHPDCNRTIDRGLAFCCGGEHGGGEEGCGLYFCGNHMYFGQNTIVCERCEKHEPPFESKPEHPEWMEWVLTDSSWETWRKDNPKIVKKYEEELKNDVRNKTTI